LHSAAYVAAKLREGAGNLVARVGHAFLVRIDRDQAVLPTGAFQQLTQGADAVDAGRGCERYDEARAHAAAPFCRFFFSSASISSSVPSVPLMASAVALMVGKMPSKDSSSA
jgi:hypothetical protein